MALKYPPFTSSLALEQAARNKPALRMGARGVAVALLQGGLLQLGFKLPKSTRPAGAPDGIFGHETRVAVTAFQTSRGLLSDSVVGAKTLLVLDGLLVAAMKPAAHSPPPPPAIPSSGDYKIGTDDPPLGHDRGSGRWSGTPVQASYRALRASIYASLPAATVVIGDDAAKHMKHYLDGSGSAYVIDLAGMVGEVPSARERYEDEIDQAREYVETLPAGKHEISSRQAEVGYNTQEEKRNWYFAIGGYSTWGRGTATVSEDAGGRRYQLDFEYKFYDRYNWDKGKSVTFANITVTDHFMGEFHRQGLAQEFDCVGAFRRKLAWKVGERISRSQMDPPAAGRS